MKKSVLITGGAKRIGADMAKRFAGIGYHVIIHYFISKDIAWGLADNINSGNGSCTCIYADLRNENDIKNLFRTAINTFGNVDVLVNNAAIFPSRHSVSKFNLSDWNNTIATNLTAQMLTSVEFAKQDINCGRIINFSSIGGIKTWSGRTDYNVSKAAVIQLTKNLAKELAPRISVNCICPGIVKIDDETLAIPVDRVPMQRYATTDDIFDAVNFFASASKYITGQTLLIDGGLSLF